MGTLRGEVHMAPLPHHHHTPCCNQPLSDLPRHHLLTDDPVEVTCPVSWSGRGDLDRMVEQQARSAEKAGESLERLLKVRARLARASSSEINSQLRRELLGLIDRGERWTGD